MKIICRAIIIHFLVVCITCLVTGNWQSSWMQRFPFNFNELCIQNLYRFSASNALWCNRKWTLCQSLFWFWTQTPLDLTKMFNLALNLQVERTQILHWKRKKAENVSYYYYYLRILNFLPEQCQEPRISQKMFSHFHCIIRITHIKNNFKALFICMRKKSSFLFRFLLLNSFQ